MQKCDKFSDTWQNQIQINVSVFPTLRGSWIVVPSLPPWFHFRLMSPALILCVRVFFLTSPYTCTLRPMLSLDPYVLGRGLGSLFTRWRKDRITRSCSSHNLCHVTGEEYVFLPFLYIKLNRLQHNPASVWHLKTRTHFDQQTLF